jgi:RNA polymerase primary sigma factor
MDVEKILINDDEEEFSAIARLIELGRQKSYVTLDDILHFFPEAEQDVEQLEEAFSALLSAGIPFVEDAVLPEPTEDDLAAVEESGDAEPEPRSGTRRLPRQHRHRRHHRLYLKEVSRVPLLTARKKSNWPSVSKTDALPARNWQRKRQPETPHGPAPPDRRRLGCARTPHHCQLPPW